MKKAFIAVLTLYKRYLSPLLPPACRFHPSCSSYSMEAFEKYGVVRGAALTCKRLLKCHPLHPGGFDPLR